VRILAALAVAAFAAVAGAGDARACSCLPPDPDAYLKKYDGAIVGRLVEVRASQGGSIRNRAGSAVYVFDVDAVLKGDIPRRLEVTSAASGASCGLEAGIGAPIGLFLEQRDGGWHSALCLQVAAEDLERAAERAGIVPAKPRAGPVDDESSSAGFSWLAAALALGLALGAAVVLRRRHP
jgi:hypothetical protein